jgi:hypothetical protein
VVFVGGCPYGHPVSNSKRSFLGKLAVGVITANEIAVMTATSPDFDIRELRSDPTLLKKFQPVGLLGVIRDVEAEIAKFQALLVRAVAELSQQRADSEVAVAEIAAELSSSMDDARRRIADAEALTSRLPMTLASMEAGKLDLARASKVCGATVWLSDDDARAADGVLEKRLPGKDVAQVQKAASYVARKVDPDGPGRRTRKRGRSRGVSVTYHRRGVASLSITNATAGRVNAAFERVDHAARKLRNGAQSRSLDELRAEVAIGLLMGETGSASETDPSRSTELPSSSVIARLKWPRLKQSRQGWLHRSRGAEGSPYGG